MKFIPIFAVLTGVCSIYGSPAPAPGSIQITFSDMPADHKFEGKSMFSNDRGYSSSSKSTILDKLEKDGRFKKFLRYLSESRNLRDELDDTRKSISVFAPTDCGFEDFEEQVRGSKEEVEDVLSYHILRKDYDYKDLKHHRTVETSLKLRSLEGEHQRIRLMTIANRLYAQMAMVEEQLTAQNGNILVVDKVLMPPFEIKDKIFQFAPFWTSITYSALAHSELIKALGENRPYTLFSPSDNAWHSVCHSGLFYLFSPAGRKDLRDIMLNHVVEGVEYASWKEGKGVTLKNVAGNKIEVEVYKQGKNPVIMLDKLSKMTFADGPAENGVIHTINYPLFPHHMTKKLSDICSGNESANTMFDENL